MSGGQASQVSFCFRWASAQDEALARLQVEAVKLRTATITDKNFRYAIWMTTGIASNRLRPAGPTSCKAEPGSPRDKYPWLSEEENRKLK